MNPTPSPQSALSPTIFVIFGITGDLARRKLIPALLNLYVEKRLPKQFAVIGFSRRHFSREDFRHFIRHEMNIKPGDYREEDIKHFLDHMSYEQGTFDSAESYKALAARIASIDSTWRVCSNKLFHLSVPPSNYDVILDRLSESGLTVSCVEKPAVANYVGSAMNPEHEGWTRILVEKPFGDDVETAKKLERKLSELFDETQIFRIDHYLAKETLQNIIAFRFANSLFESLWNRDHIDKIHIRLLEKIDIEGRGAFYDTVGALRDVGQNHVLQMLALVAMDEPESFTADAIRKERMRVLKSLDPITGKQLSSQTVRGQYEGYLQEKGVKPNSSTETYFRLETYVKNSRWKDVPFYLESGKAMKESRGEINVYFKNPHHEDRQNVLTFRIHPDEGIKIRFWVKTPGFGMNIEAKTLRFKYSDFPAVQSIPDAYERLIFDAILGDQTLFASTEEVLYAWKFITPIVEGWPTTALTLYRKGADHIT